jgi:hypothetical protein
MGIQGRVKSFAVSLQPQTLQPPTSHRTRMTRGKKPVAAIKEAKKFAERMGYRWQENTDNPDLAYDLQCFKPGYAMLVKVRVPRYPINPNDFYEELLADDLREVRALPFPAWMPREIWLRTRHERGWRRLRVFDVAVSEIEWWKPDGCTNPHAR